MFEPKHLKRWTMPECYFGEVWPNYYSAGVGQTRDSDALERSNFVVMLRVLGGESDTVIVVRERHWAVGWVEWIAIHQDDKMALKIADQQIARLEAYPILDEDHFSDLEWNEAADYWDSLSPRDKVQMAIEERERMHWCANEPCWIYGRMDYSTLVNYESDISNHLYERLRKN